MVTLAGETLPIWLGQDRGDLFGIEVSDRSTRRPLCRNPQHGRTLLRHEWLARGYEQEEAAQRRQPTVARADAAVPHALNMLEERQHLDRSEISETESGHLAAAASGHKAQE